MSIITYFLKNLSQIKNIIKKILPRYTDQNVTKKSFFFNQLKKNFKKMRV